ncbi:MAG TPA: ParB N-terminal domain-containing protein, partial [Gemmatimonadales bacterium]|nr:ParB N-terminal domain-containing protein [Gemmatimonadales bacterium]
MDNEPILPADRVVDINLIRVPERYRHIMGDLESLADSINTYGMIDPIIVTADYELRHGGRRLEAAKMLRLREVPIRFYRADVDALIVERESQIREDYRPSEKVALANAILAKLGDGRTDRGNPDRLEGSRHEVAAKGSGFESEASFRRARKVVSRGTKKLIEAMDDGKIAIAGAFKIANLPHEQQEKAIDLMVNKGVGVDRAIEAATGHPAEPVDAGDA